MTTCRQKRLHANSAFRSASTRAAVTIPRLLSRRCDELLTIYGCRSSSLLSIDAFWGPANPNPVGEPSTRAHAFVSSSVHQLSCCAIELTGENNKIPHVKAALAILRNWRSDSSSFFFISKLSRSHAKLTPKQGSSAKAFFMIRRARSPSSAIVNVTPGRPARLENHDPIESFFLHSTKRLCVTFTHHCAGSV